MKRFSSTIVALSLCACGAGRKAAWEQDQVRETKAATAQPVGEADPFEAAMKEGQAAWDGKRDTREGVEAAIAAWEKAAALKPEDGTVFEKLSRALYFLSDGYLRKPENRELYLATFERGTAAGERALVNQSAEFKKRVTAGEKVDDAIKVVGREGLASMYWYASNLGKWARAKGFTTLLGNKDRIRAVMTRALEIDESFFYGAPHRYFGAFYAVAPSFSGGDLGKSKDHYDKSLAIAPNYLGTHVLIADNYSQKKQDRALFDKELDFVINAPVDGIPDLVPEAKVEKEKAAELKARGDELF